MIMRPWIYVPGGIIPAVYKSCTRLYEQYPELVKHPRLSAIKEALFCECIRDTVPLLLVGLYLLAPGNGTPDKIGIGALSAFVGGQIYLGASCGADSGFK